MHLLSELSVTRTNTNYMANFKKPSVDQLKKALVIAEKIKELEGQLAAILGSGVSSSALESTVEDTAVEAPAKRRGRKPGVKKAKKGKRELSPEARERIAAAQRRRWAAAKGS